MRQPTRYEWERIQDDKIFAACAVRDNLESAIGHAEIALSCLGGDDEDGRAIEAILDSLQARLKDACDEVASLNDEQYEEAIGDIAYENWKEKRNER